ncbi:MAG: hypothetical protein E7226_06995 [Clostridiales bacterium]|nr:hypothetical protein [Clostridiales bacterium]
MRRLAERDVKDHTALFDLYVTVGRDIDYLSIKFGINPEDLINLLEGYGEKLRVTAADVAADPKLATAIMEDKTTAKAIEEFGMALDYSGKGRLKKLSRLLIEEYVEHFYPGIASEHPENDWICIEAYLDQMHPGWRGQLDAAGGSGTADGASGAGNDGQSVQGKVKSSKPKRKVRNNFRLY